MVTYCAIETTADRYRNAGLGYGGVLPIGTLDPDISYHEMCGVDAKLGQKVELSGLARFYTNPCIRVPGNGSCYWNILNPYCRLPAFAPNPMPFFCYAPLSL